MLGAPRVQIALAYVFPMINLPKWEPLARRFVKSYFDHPPGDTAHQIHVLANGLAIDPARKKIFDSLPCAFHTCSNQGMDIGAYQWAADHIPCDLLLCFGTPVHFRKAGWLDLIASTFLEHGPNLYGAWGFHAPKMHIRTTAFWLPPQILKAYPVYVGDSQRYAFEHGDGSITRFAIDAGLNALQVTWTGVFPPSGWHHTPLEESLLLDQHTDRLGYA